MSFIFRYYNYFNYNFNRGDFCKGYNPYKYFRFENKINFISNDEF